MSVHDRRIQHEWEFLQRLAELNPDLIAGARRKLVPDGAVFHFLLTGTPALSGFPPNLNVFQKHSLSLCFPQFFPAVPMEAFLEQPVFHPNVHPENGFVCLWDRFSSGDNTVDAVVKLQRVLSWELYNDSPEHLMQPEALAWSDRSAIPLPYTRVQIPPELASECGYRGPVPTARRRRLSDIP